VVTDVREQAPLTQVTGWVPLLPVDVRSFIEGRDDLEVLVSEDEGYESELLVSDGTSRVFVKARALCDGASVLAEVIAPEDAAGGLPAPAGTPTPGP
ncbi:MAG: hypothetical protein M3O86_05090, partial [Actinomycetota bacterium]|nr:hypothetical protein [Actinomycetota bacterium]